MSSISIIRRHSVLIYFTLTLLISWGLVISVVGITGIPGTKQEQKDLLYSVVFTLLAGPIISSLSLIGILYGRSGYHELASRLGQWKAAIHWYVLALLLAPVLGFMTLILLVPVSNAYLPVIITSQDKVGLLLMGLLIGLSAGIFEEIGWTGFAIPELRKKYDVYTTGIIVGIVWGIWHFITAFWAAGNEQGQFVFTLFLPMFVFYVAVLPAYRMIMVWVYDHTHSLFKSILMHASLTGNVIYLLLPPELTELALTLWYIVFSVPLWLVVVILLKNDRKNVLPLMKTVVHPI